MDLRLFIFCASVLCVFLHVVCARYEINDDTAYKLVWDSDRTTRNVGFHGQSISMSTNAGENYECTVPPLNINESNVNGALVNPSERELLEELFRKQPCSIRVEFYWSYELCHKKHIRQFHEELLPDKSSKLQEYFLGYRSGDKSSVSAPFDPLAKPPAILLGEVLYPYYTINFTDGTTCDLTNTRRMSSVLYICLEEEDGRIIQVSEVESCHYQLVFATKSLCANAAYRIPKRPVHSVSCVPRSDAPNKPGALVAFEEDQRKLNYHGVSNLAALLGRLEFQNIQVEAERKNNMLIYRIRTVDPISQSQAKPVDFSDESMAFEEEPNQAASQIAKVKQLRTEIKKPGGSSQMHTSTVAPEIMRAANREQFLAFLQGRFCLTGMMTGWWNHEICFNKNVTQYHVDDHGSRSQRILLGEWNREAHEKWVEQQPLKKDQFSKPTSRIFDLFYGNGDFCEEIQAKREVVVKMRCEQSAAGIHLSFAENSVCRYSVLIESATFCDFPDDEFDGLIV